MAEVTKVPALIVRVPLIWGAQNVLPRLQGGGGVEKVSDLQFSHFVTPSPPHN